VVKWWGMGLMDNSAICGGDVNVDGLENFDVDR